MPDHITPQDIIQEGSQQANDLESSQLNQDHLIDTVSQQKIPNQQVEEIIAKDEFKLASQSVIDDITLRIIHESITGKLNLNEKLARSNTRIINTKTSFKIKSQAALVNNTSKS